MRKQYLGLALASFLSLGMFSGCSNNKVSLDDLMSDSKSALEEVNSANLELGMNVDISIESSGFEVPMIMDLTMEGDMVNDPSSMNMTMDLAVSMLGQEESMTGQVYVVEEDGQTVTYAKSSELAGWTREVNSNFEFEEIITPDFLDNFDKDTLQLETTDEKINDQAVYLLTGKMKSEAFEEAMPEMGSDLLGSAGVFDDTTSTTSNMQIDGKVYLYKDSKLPAKITLDLKDGFDEMLSASMQDSLGSDASCTINEFVLTLTFNEYNKVDQITVPEEVLSASSTPSTVKCSGILSDMDTVVNLTFDSNEQLMGLEMIMRMEMGDEQSAAALLGQEETFKEAMGVGDDTLVLIETDGSQVIVTMNMDIDAMQNSDLFAGVDLGASKEDMVSSMEIDAGLVCVE